MRLRKVNRKIRRPWVRQRGTRTMYPVPLRKRITRPGRYPDG